MVQFAQLVVGSFFLATVSAGSWLAGLLMGLALARLMSGRGGKHADVDALLARQRQQAGSTRTVGPASPPLATPPAAGG